MWSLDDVIDVLRRAYQYVIDNPDSDYRETQRERKLKADISHLLKSMGEQKGVAS